ncbi:hypothetical protein RJ640_016385, partial [Escallonia rubra]
MDVERGLFETGSDHSTNSVRPSGAPGAELTRFASRLAMLEKAAAGLGALGFIWASGVLLGGFASSLAKTDFWFINVILLIEGIRIFSRRQIIRWQHHTPWSLTGAVRRCSRAIKATARALAKVSRCSRGTADTAENTDERSHVNSISRKTLKWTKTTVLSLVLYCFQLASSTTCVTLSLMKLIKHICGDVGDANERNQQLALNIFYSLALAEALLFLLEKAYSEWMIMHRKLLEEVNKECQLGPSSIIYVTRFLDDSFSACVNGSIFDGRQKDMVSFAMDLLVSNVLDDQLHGAGILQKFAANEDFSYVTLQKVGITTSVMVRLVEMLNWKAVEQKEIRKSAAEILVKLARRKHKPLQVAGIPGVMESISSLLNDDSAVSAYDYLNFTILGLRILKKLCRDLSSCGKIGNTRGLLQKIIKLTYANERLLKGERTEEDQILIVKRSLQVVEMLSSTTGTTGKQLRKEISEVVVTIRNIRDMLQHGEKHPRLQVLGIRILINLAMEEDGRELVGCTGNVIKELFNIYLKQEVPVGPEEDVIGFAGAALAVLTIESTSNCQRILKLKVMESLVLKGIFTTGDDYFLEAMVGLAAQVFKYMTTQESSAMFERAGVQEAELAKKLVQILKSSKGVSLLRRYVVELAIVMMREKDTNVQHFKDLGMEKELEHVLETTTQRESFYLIGGSFGVSRHGTPIHSLVETAMELLA